MHIRAAVAADTDALASILCAAFATDWPEAFPTLEAARATLADVAFLRVAVADDNDGEVMGIIGGLVEYDGRVVELHPLAVAPRWQGRGVGAALVAAFEAEVRASGALTIIVGTDDENDLTSLSGIDLYDDLVGHLGRVTARPGKRHPFVFYRKLGFVVSGVIPDANGRGRPDILMSKRV